MKKRILVPTLVVGALLTGSLALADPGNFGGNGRNDCAGCNNTQQKNCDQQQGRKGQRLEMMSTVLDLSNEQKQQVEVLWTQQRQENQQLREQIRASRTALHKVETAETFNEADFRTQAAKQAELKTEMMVRKAKLKQKMFALLTTEQQEKADKLGDLRSGNGRGNGRHGGRGFGF